VHYIHDTKTIHFLGLNLLLATLNHEAEPSATVRLSVEGRPGGLYFDFPTTAVALLEGIANPIIITRHGGLVDYIRSLSPDMGELEVLTHATPADVMGRVVVGVLPPHLASIALLRIEIPLDFGDPALRGAELTCSQVSSIAGSPRFYRVLGV
jgi:hypothetical protein